ncbi:MAG: hypothetical protein V4519_05250 [Patescibacteria group bacterium]
MNERIFLQENEGSEFDIVNDLFYKSHNSEEKRALLSRMERAATTVDQLNTVLLYVMPDTTMERMVKNRIKALQNPGENQTAA